MAQHDYVIDNSTGANVRADINSVLQAIVTNNSGSSAPSATFPFMLFADSSAGTMKIRNAADNAFIELFQLDGTFTLEDGSASAPALAFRDDLNTGIFSGGANEFNIATGGTERFVILSSGNCGINTTNPTAQLAIAGGGAYTAANSGKAVEGIDIQSSSGDVSGAFGGAISFGLGQTGRAAIAAVQNSTDDDNVGLAFFTHPSNTGTANAEEKMRLISSGRLGIGTTSPTGNLEVFGSLGIIVGNASGSGKFFADGGATKIGSKTNHRLDLATNDTTRVSVDTSGNVGIGTTSPSAKLRVVGDITASGSITGGSDLSYKKDIKPLANVLSKVTQLLGVNFTYKENNEKSMGLVAQDVEKVFPELVKGEEGNKSLNYMGLTGALIEAIKELSAKVEALETA